MTLRRDNRIAMIRKVLPHFLAGILLLFSWTILEFFAEGINFHTPHLILKIDKPSMTDTVQVFYNLGNGFTQEDSTYADILPQDRPMEVGVAIPDRSLIALRIDPKLQPGTLTIESMELHTRYAQYQWSAKDLASRFFPWNDMEEFEVRNDLLRLRCTGKDPYFVGPYSIARDLPVPPTSFDIRYSIDVVRTEPHYILLQGWAFLEEWFPRAGEVFLVVRSGDRTFLFDTFPMVRKDVSKKYGSLNRLDLSGFVALLHPSVLPQNKTYSLGLVVKNDRQQSFVNVHKNMSL